MTTTVGKKLTTLRSDPAGALTSNVRRLAHELGLPAARRRVAQRRALRRLEQLGVAGPLAAFVAKRPAEAIPPDYVDLLRLYELVVARRPRELLEFGSGCSTLVLALAARRAWARAATSGRFVSIESDPEWAELNRAALPPELAQLCTIEYSPVVEAELGGVGAWRHERLPAGSPDFVYLDGPALTDERPFSLDLLELEPSFAEGFVLVVDGRPANAHVLATQFKRRYRIQQRRNPLAYVFELEPGGRES